jgi:enoyl-CoA hydratase/carnithine racemase
MNLSTEKIIAEKEGQIGWLRFNNPERRNAISLSMWQAIPEVLANFEADPEVRVIVVTGVGNKAFAAGADISEFEEARSSAETAAIYAEHGEKAYHHLATTTKPTLAMIHGFCIGGGVAVALSCDLRLAAEDAQFSVPAAKLGLGYGLKHLSRLVDVVGPANAKEILFTARLFSADEARAMGLVNRVIPGNVLAAYVQNYCEAIAANAPLTISATKKIIAEITNRGKPIDQALCEQLVQTCFDSEDYAEGRRAFMEKRKPVFRGR